MKSPSRIPVIVVLMAIAVVAVERLLAEDRAQPAEALIRLRVQATRDLLRARTDVVARDEPLANVLRRVAANHKIRIWFDEAAIRGAGVRLDERVTIVLRNFPAEAAIERLLRGRGLQPWIDDDVLVIGIAAAAKPAPFTVRRGFMVAENRVNDQGVIQRHVSDDTFDAWVFGNDRNASAIRARFAGILRHQTDAAAERCSLTEAQQQKLQLAGRGDVARFFERLNSLRSDFSAVKDDDKKRVEFFDLYVVPLEATLERGPFGPESLFAKTLATILTPEQAGHSSPRQNPSYDNLTRIGLALSGYYDRFGRLPGAVMTGPDGKSTYSWRVELVPMLRYYVDRQPDDEDDDILSGGLNPDEVRRAHWKQIEALGYHLNQPWDSAENRAFQKAFAQYYRHPADAAESENSSFFVVTGEGTAFPAAGGIQLSDVSDGPGSTLIVVDARRDIPWTKPQDIPFDPAKPLPPFGGFDKTFFLALTGDGAVHPISSSTPEKELRALTTRQARDSFSITGIPWRSPAEAATATDETSTGAFTAVVAYDGPPPAPVNLKVPGGAPILDKSLLVDAETGGIANVVVYFDKVPAGVPIPAAPREPSSMTVAGGQFVPHFSVLRTGQNTLMTNNDRGPENVHTSPIVNPGTNHLLPPGGQANWSYARAEKLPVVIHSDLHPWMKAYQVVVDHPWAAVSNATGALTVKGLPAGTYQFKVWHEVAGYLERSLEVEIKAGETTEMKLVYPAERFRR